MISALRLVAFKVFIERILWPFYLFVLAFISAKEIIKFAEIGSEVSIQIKHVLLVII